jgi:Ca2+-binding RTX toxin-like protein
MAIFGNNANNHLDGTGAGDTIWGLGGDDILHGFGGNDLLIGGSGADDIDGGAGSDTSSYQDSTAGVTVSLISNTGSGGYAEGDTLNNIENLYGSAHNDFLIGNDGANILSGLGGNDTLKGGGGADTLYGDSGNDMLKGGGGADQLNGGSGIDTANYFDSGAGVFVWLGGDHASGGDAEGDELNSIENVTGSAYADNLWGSDGNNVLNGNDGNDSLKGFGGADTLNGGNGNDSLYGMDGIDTLSGGHGNDQLQGGAGSDTLTGGLGADTFTWTAEEGGFVGPNAHDRITDFNLAQGDLVNLFEMDADIHSAGNQSFSFLGSYGDSGGFSAAGQITYIHSEGSTYLLVNTDNVFVDGDGNADAELVIQIDGYWAPDSGWFVL